MQRRTKIGPSICSIATAVLFASPVGAALRLEPEIAVGSQGYGAALIAPLNRTTDVRVRYDTFSFGVVSTADETLVNSANSFQPAVGAHIPFDANVRLANFGLFVDRHIRNSAFYVSAGVIYNTNRISAISRTAESTFNINGTVENGGNFGPISIDVRWNPLAPYAGLGVQARRIDGDRMRRGMRVDLGAYYQGARRIDVHTSGIVAANPAIFGPYVDAFAAKVPGYLPRLPWYPVLRVSAPL